jgi:hypothetical protein
MSGNPFDDADHVGATRCTIPDPESPSCHDAVTTTCPVCQQTFTPTGRQKFCSDKCRAAAYRRRRDTARAAVTVPKSRPRRPITVYECDGCGARALGQQRCDTCSTFMRKIGVGGECPHCGEPLATNELAPGVIDAD